MIDGAAVTAVRTALARVVGERAAVVVAVSGGADSVGMARLVAAARPDLDLRVLHVRHGLRDDVADADAARRCAQQLSLPFSEVAVAVRPDGTGPENAARGARMTAFANAAREAGAAAVCTGHTADDNAETMLLNLARGTGLAGLAGIPAQRSLADGVLLVRPVLELRRAVVRAAAGGFDTVQDPTNADPEQRRFRARSQLLPLLESLTGQHTDPVVALLRLANHARSDSAALDTIAAVHYDTLVQTWGSVAMLPISALEDVPRAIATRVLRLTIAAAGGGSPPSEAAVEAVLHLRNGQAVTLSGGVMASRGGGRIAVAPAGGSLPERRLDAGGVPLPEIGMALTCDASSASGELPPWAPAASAAFVPLESIDGVVVRARRDGDRIHTAAGTQTVADAMVAAGVPRIARGLVPVVADDDGPLWVPGVAVRAGASGDFRLRLVPATGR